MIDAIRSILDFLSMIAHAVEYLIKGLAQMFAMIPSAFTMLTYSIGFLPSMLLAFASVALTVTIILFIIGR